MRRTCGQSIGEYALIMALVVLVAIPAVWVLGEQVQETLAYTNGNSNRVDELIGLLSVDDTGSTLAVTPIENISSAMETDLTWDQLPQERYHMRYSAETGDLFLAPRDQTMLDSGSEATSADGINMMVGQLDLILGTWRDSEGEALPEEIHNPFARLAELGHRLGDSTQFFQSEIVDAGLNTQPRMDGSRAESEPHLQVLEDYVAFNEQFYELSYEIANSGNAEYQGLLDTYVEKYSGVISHLSNHFIGEYGINQVTLDSNSNETYNYLRDDPSVLGPDTGFSRTQMVGFTLDPAGIPVASIPEENHRQSDNIENAAVQTLVLAKQ